MEYSSAAKRNILLIYSTWRNLTASYTKSKPDLKSKFIGTEIRSVVIRDWDVGRGCPQKDMGDLWE